MPHEREKKFGVGQLSLNFYLENGTLRLSFPVKISELKNVP